MLSTVGRSGALLPLRQLKSQSLCIPEPPAPGGASLREVVSSTVPIVREQPKRSSKHRTLSSVV